MDGLVIGLDLNDEYTQISCYGKEISWTIPTVICRKKEGGNLAYRGGGPMRPRFWAKG